MRAEGGMGRRHSQSKHSMNEPLAKPHHRSLTRQTLSLSLSLSCCKMLTASDIGIDINNQQRQLCDDEPVDKIT